MPLSNVFRHSFPNPFHNLSRKNRHAHARSGSAAGSPSSIIVVPVVKDKSNSNIVDFITPLPSTLGRSDSRKSISLRDKGKDKDIGKPRRKGSQATSKSAHSALSACHLERLDPDTILQPSSPSSDQISHPHISRTPLHLSLQEQQQQQHMSALSSPTSTSFSPSQFSPYISMPTSPTSPSAPSTPLSANSPARILSASSEPLTPTLPSSPTNLATPGTLGSRSRFGSLFTLSKTRHNSKERVLSDPEVHARMGKDKIDPALLKKKHMSSGSLQIPIGAFLSSTFRNKQQEAQQQPSQPESLQPVQEQDQTQTEQQQPLQRKKRRGLLPKLPKLDTRPRINISRSGSKKQKKAVKQVGTGYGDNGSCSTEQAFPEISTQDPNAASGPDLEWVVVPGSTATVKQGGGGGRRKSSTKLLSPFYLRRQIRTGAGPHSSQNLDPNVRFPPPMMGSTGEKNDSPTATTTSGSQARQQFVDFYPAFEFEWQADSQVFYDDRWDRASVRTVDTEIVLLADDPNFPGYPERNDYWQQHCRIRERRWKHQIQKHQQQQMMDTRSPKKWLNGVKADPVTGLAEDYSGSLLEEDDEDDEERITDQDDPLADRLRDVTDLLNSLPERTARRDRQSIASSSSHQDRFRQRRVRYTTYSAYIAAMQVKSKNRTDHKRSLDVAAMASPTAGIDADKLMTDVRALRERSMTQPANAESADKLGDALMSGDTMADPHLDSTRQSSLPEAYHGKRRYAHHRDGTNLGSSDDESEDQYETEDRVHPMSSFASLQRQRQPDSGILFVAAAATTAEVYPTLVHDPREQLLNKSAKSATTTSGNKLKDLTFSSQLNKNASTAPYWIEDGYDEGMIGCLVGSYFDEKVLEDRFGGKSDMEGGEGDEQSGGDKMVGNGFMMLQSSFGDQGSLDAHNGPDLDPSGRRSSAPDAVNNSNSNSNSNLNDKNNNDDINNYTNNDDNNNNDNRNSCNNKKDICLSRPGQYASHNHIMPLEKLLEVEEQERQRRRRALLEKQELDRQKRLMMEMEEQQQQQVLIYPDGAAFDATKPTTTATSTTIATPSLLFSSSTSPAQPLSSSQPIEGAGGGNSSGSGDTFLANPSTATSVPDTAASSQQPTDSKPTSLSQPQARPRGSGHMLLVLDRGRCQYYENGTRKRDPQWEEGGSKDGFVGHDATEMIEEGEEDVDEEELAWVEQQRLRQDSSLDLERAQRGKNPSDGTGSSRVHPFNEPAAGGGGGGVRERVPSQEVDPLGSLAVIDSPLSPRFANVLSESPTVSAKSSQVFSPQSSRPSTPSSVNALALPPHAQSMVVTSSISSSSTNLPAHQASAHGLSTLSRIRAIKSRASLSYSVLPTLSKSSYTSSNVLTPTSEATSASISTTTLLSSVPSTLLNNPSLRHRGSGSMTPGSTLYSGGGTTPATHSSPLATPVLGAVANGGKAHLSSSSSSALLPGRKLSWSDVPNQPPTVTTTTTTTPSAIALLLDALIKPSPPPPTPQGNGTGAPSKSLKSDPAQRLKQQWDQRMRSQSVLCMPPSAMTAKSRSMLLSPPPMTSSGSKAWIRNPVHLFVPPPPPPSSGQGDTAVVDKRQHRRGALSDGDLETHLETEADQEMEDELRQLQDDATHDNAQYQTKKAAATSRTKRAMSMVELSASTTASQYKAAVSATRQRYKAEASTSTSTVDILQSEGMYQWNEFFDV